MRIRARFALRVGATAVLGVALAGCGSDSAGSSDEPSVPTGVSTASQSPPPQAATPIDSGVNIVEGLAVPWSMTFLPDGTALVTERDDAAVVRVARTPSGQWQTSPVEVVDGVNNEGEGGLLGVTVAPQGPTPSTASPAQVYLYWSTATDNRVGVASFDGTTLSEPQVILEGIPHSGIHNGGRLAFGPDGMLYVGTGDAADADAAQDPTSLAGKILRINADGSVPTDNPLPDSPVFSLGHRNVQGLAFDADGRLWASEFGAADADELNLIVPGGNYGWPAVEGAGGEPEFLDPAAAWEPTSVASPSGLAIADGSAWVAALRGETLWQVPLDGEVASTPIAHFASEFGRLRDVVRAPDGSLWVLTNNTDVRGSPGPGDDRIVALTLG